MRRCTGRSPGASPAIPSARTIPTPTSAPTISSTPRRPRKLLAAAGYPNGLDLELEWAEFQGWNYGEFAQLVARFYNDVGLRVKLKQLETSTWLAKVTGVQPFTHMLAAASPIGAGPELHGLGLPALPLVVSQDHEPRGDQRSQARRSARHLASGPGRQAPGAPEGHLGPSAQERLPHHHHRAAALPRHASRTPTRAATRTAGSPATARTKPRRRG